MAKGQGQEEELASSTETIWRQLDQIERAKTPQGFDPARREQRLREVGQTGTRGAAEVLRGVFRWLRQPVTDNAICESELLRGRLEDTRIIWDSMDKALHPYWRRVWGQKWEDLTSMRYGEQEAGPAGLLTVTQHIKTLLSQCERCQSTELRRCPTCGLPRCDWCVKDTQSECQGCGTEWPRQKRVGPRGADRGPWGQLHGRNMHNAGKDFVEEVVDCRWRPDASELAATAELHDRLEFKCRLRGWEPEARKQRIDDLLDKHTGVNAEGRLMRALLNSEPPILLFFPAQQFPTETPVSQESGWWYKARTECTIRRCGRCWQQKRLDHFDKESRRPEYRRPECHECQALPKSRRARLATESEGVRIGLSTVTADPRYMGRGDDTSGGDVLVDGPGLKHILRISRDHPAEGMEVWLTTGQMGFAVEREEDELGAEEDLAAQIPTSRYLAPQISAFIQRLREQGTTTMPADIWEALEALEDTWGRGDEETQVDGRPRKRRWEKPSCPLAMQDPRYLPEVSLSQQLGKNWFLNEGLPRTNTGAGYVRVQATAMRWEEPAGRFQVLVGEGLATSVQPEHEWSIMSAQWRFLVARWTEQGSGEVDIVPLVSEEVRRQHGFERAGMRSISWRLLKAIQAATGAEVLIGGTAVVTPPFFRAMGRGNRAIWGELEGPAIVLWDQMDDLERKQWQQAFANRTDWVILCERSQRHHACSGPLPPGKDWCVLHRGGTQGEDRRGRALREKGWWHRGSVRLAENSHTLVCRVPSNTGMRAHGRYGIEQAWFCRREKDDLSMHLEGLEGDYWLGTEAGSIGAYGFRGVVMATDGSATHGKMGAGYSELSRGLVGSEWQEASAEEGGSGKCLDCPEAARAMGRGEELPWHLQKQLVAMGAEDGDHVVGGGKLYCITRRRRKACLRVGREEEGASSLRPELAAIERVLQTVDVADDLLILSDCQTELTEIQKWIGEGLRPCMAMTKDADILRSVVERLRQRITAGAATWLVKIKAHRGEPLNEEADDEAGKGCLLLAEEKQWDDLTSRNMYAWKTAEGAERRAPWGQGVRQAITKRAGWTRVALEHHVGYRKWVRRWWITSDTNGQAPNREEWQQVSTQWWGNREEWESAGARLQQAAGGKRKEPVTGTSQEVFKDSKKPTLSTWTAEYLIRPGQNRKGLHKWLKNRRIPYGRRRRLLQIMSYSYPCGSFLKKIRRSTTGKCRLCRKLRPHVAEDQLAEETVGHITSARCVGQSAAATAAHNRCVRAVMQALGAEEDGSKGRTVLTVEGEQEMTTLWSKEELREIVPWEQVQIMARQARRARLNQSQEDEAELQVTETERLACSLCMAPDCISNWRSESGAVVCCQCTEQTASRQGRDLMCERCWTAKTGRQRFDGVAIDTHSKPKRLLIVEVKRMSDRQEDYWRQGAELADQQYADLCEGIRNSLPPTWECRFVPIILGSMAIQERAFEEAMQQLGITKAGGRALMGTLMNILLEEQDKMLRSFQAQLGEKSEAGADAR